MKGDFTRSTFDRRNHYSGVRMQQGRVQIDADWNEQIDLTRNRIETEALDLIGGCGAPLHADGFRIVGSAAELTAAEAARPGNASVPPLTGSDDFLLTAGRIYVDGVLVENDQIVAYRGQPYLADPEPVETGTYVVYLDVFDRHRTALEAPAIREVALGGPDTATRTQTVWQVRLFAVAAGTTCVDTGEWSALTSPPDGQMAARAEESAATEDPCIVAPGAGYRALENRLYRVEVHAGGDRSVASFKWSRDNGTVVAGWTGENVAAATITVSTLGRDDVLRFVGGGWVELIDDDHELRGEPGTLVRITNAEDNVLTLDLATAIGTELQLAAFPSNPRVRRWDGVITAPAAGAWNTLEDGVQVTFGAGTYRTGDHWLVPARTATGDVEWPRDGLLPASLSPHGVQHHYCRLAVMDFEAGTGWSDRTDCRRLFPPVTELTSLFYVSGDGQEATPVGTGGVALDHPLRVGVANGRWPVAGAAVRYRVVRGVGTVNGAAEVALATGADGTAQVSWSLGALGELQAVEATLLNAGGTPIHLPIVFTARYRVGAEEPGIEVVRIAAGSTDFQNDAPLAVDRLQAGFVIVCSAAIDARTVIQGKPVCYVTLYVPWPMLGDELQGWSVNRPIATRPIRLNGVIAAQDELIFWQPEPATAAWLDTLIGAVAQFELGSVLGYLTLEGNYIQDEGAANRRYLDGETFGALRADDRTDAILPSGDGRRGGSLQVWFHLVRSEGQPGIAVSPAKLNFGAVAVGNSLTRTVNVSNPGPSSLSVTGVRFDPDDGHYLVVPSTFEVGAGAQRSIEVRFSPQQTGQLQAVFDFVSNASGNAEVSVRGVGRQQPQVRARLQVLHMSTALGPVVDIGMTQETTVPDVVASLARGAAAGFFDVEITAPTQTFDVRDPATGEVIRGPTGAPIRIALQMQPGNAYVLVLCGLQVAGFTALADVRESAADRERVHVRPYNATPDQKTLDISATASLPPCQGAPEGPEIEPQVTTFAVITGPETRDQFRFDLREYAGRSVTAVAVGTNEPSMRLVDDKGLLLTPLTGSFDQPVPGILPNPVTLPNRPAILGVLGGRSLRAGAEPAVNRMAVNELTGVDAAMAERLAASGIGSVGALAAFERDDLSELLKIPKARANKLIKAARQLAEG